MILNRQRAVRVALQPLEKFLKRVREELGLGESEVTVALISDPVIARMNQSYRKKSGATDVLSFPGERRMRRKARRTAARAAEKNYLGDIAIAPEVARRNALRDGRSLATELKVLILHGVLHLLGYDHETDRGEMQRLERRLRARLGLR